MKKSIFIKDNNDMGELKPKTIDGEKISKEKEKNTTRDIYLESKDFSLYTDKEEFNIDNIDFEDLKENLNKNVYDDEKLTSNVINHIKVSLGSLVEIQWETGTKNKILVKTIGDKKGVGLSNNLLLRSEKGEKTIQMIHNHTSGTPLPHQQDIINLLNKKIINSGIVGNYGYLNMKNLFKTPTNESKNLLKVKTKDMYNKIANESFKNKSHLKHESEEVRKAVVYKYNKNNINKIVNGYNKQFKKLGISFEFTPYKLKKR